MFWGSFYAVALRGHTKFPLFKRGGARKVLPYLEAGRKNFRHAIFSFCSPPPLPTINDPSLRPVTIH